MLHNIPINWITFALSQTSTVYYSVYFAALYVNLHPVNITSNIVPVVATIRYKSTSDLQHKKTAEELRSSLDCASKFDFVGGGVRGSNSQRSKDEERERKGQSDG